MKPPPFAYARASSIDDALALLAEAGEEAKPLAGGQSLMPLLAYRLLRPTHLVDLGAIAGLDSIEERAGAVELGALVRHAALEQARLGLLSEAAGLIGHLPIRVRGTLGGSLAHADPAAELPVAVVASGAELVLRSLRGDRLVDAEAFFLGPFTTAIEPDELLVAVRVPQLPPGARAAFEELAFRGGDFALASVAAVVGESRARIVLGGVAPVPVRARSAEAIVTDAGLADDAIAGAAAAAAGECDPPDDPRVGEAYRRELVAVLVSRALRRCREEEAE